MRSIIRLTVLLVVFAFIKLNASQVLSLSAAIVDHLVFVENEELFGITQEKGGWASIDYETFCNYLKVIEGRTSMCPGGSGVNVIKGLSRLGNKCAVVGKIGPDKMGDYFIEQLSRKGIMLFLEKGVLPTGQAICFITPDGQRTFRAYVGASHSQSDLKLDVSFFQDIDLFHVEGYQLIEPDLVLRSLKAAKALNIKTSIDLANVELIRRFRPFIFEILENYVDIVLCNQDEALELTGLEPKEVCAFLAKYCPVAVVTMGEKGCWTQSGEEQVFAPAFFVAPIDTTGAGDYFASGFLDGYLKGYSLHSSSLQGALIASYVVRTVGTELSQASWDEIHLKLLWRFPAGQDLMSIFRNKDRMLPLSAR